MLRITLYMFKETNNMLPYPLSSLFQRNMLFHYHFTRNNWKYHVPLVRTTSYQKSLVFKGIIAWNWITDILPLNYSIFTFKNKLKNFLLFNDIPNIF